MSPRICVLLLVALVCVSLVASPALGRPRSGAAGRRGRHHQGESLKRPHEFLDGVDMERFTRDFEQASYKHSRKSSGEPGSFSVGAGIYDVTGQIAEIGLMSQQR